MNKAFCRKRIIFSSILAGCLILFNLSCGLDTFYVIDAPVNVVHQPDCSSIEFSDNYFEFYTADKDYDSVKFLGNDVYYKIYKSSSRLKTEAEDLQATANRDDSTNTGANKMIETYRFQSLSASGYDDRAVLIPTVGNNQKISIRLSDYRGIYLAQITVDGENLYGSSSRVIPVRNLSNKPNFNFSSTNLPETNDADVNTSGSASSDNEWYVSMFAVAVGQDSNYSNIYSNILYLGSVKIPVE